VASVNSSLREWVWDEVHSQNRIWQTLRTKRALAQLRESVCNLNWASHSWCSVTCGQNLLFPCKRGCLWNVFLCV
jgi:hypothetical protein